MWRGAWPTALSIAIGMALVAAAILTAFVERRARADEEGRWKRSSWRRPWSRSACSCSAGGTIPWRSRPPRSSCGRRSASAPAGSRGRSSCWSRAADWAAARLAGPFDTMLSGPRRGRSSCRCSPRSRPSRCSRLAFALDERDAAELARANAAERFRRTFHDSPVAMAVTTPDGRIVETNRALCQLLAMPDHRWWVPSCGPGARRQRRARALHGTRRRPRPGDAAGQLARHTSCGSRSANRRCAGGDRARRLQVVVLRDVTERTRSSASSCCRRRRWSRSARLAGGIAHDFNNVLSVMRGQVELLQDDLEVLESARARIDSVQRATDRAAALTDDLMAFSRRRVDEPEAFDVHERLHDVQRAVPPGARRRGHPRARPRGEPADDRRRPEPHRAGGPQPRRERARRDAVGRAGRRSRPAPSRRTRRVRALGHRHRRGHGRRHPRPHLRTVLHHQAAGLRYRPRPVDHRRHRAGRGRHHRGRQPPRPGHDVHASPSRPRRRAVGAQRRGSTSSTTTRPPCSSSTTSPRCGR